MSLATELWNLSLGKIKCKSASLEPQTMESQNKNRN